MMTTTPVLIKPPRRQYDAEFKSAMVAACQQPGASVAQIAMQQGINANLVHKWIRQSRPAALCSVDNPPAFIPLPIHTPAKSDSFIELTIPSTQGDIQVKWPVAQSERCAQWFKAVLS
jgi:hypothetical protein